MDKNVEEDDEELMKKGSIFDKKMEDMGLSISDEVMRSFVKKTKFEIVKQVSPQKGRVVIFDGKRFHSSTKPRNHKRRLVITVNYI